MKITALTDATVANDVEITLASTALGISKKQTVEKADVAVGTIVEFTITGYTGDVVASDLATTVADKT